MKTVVLFFEKGKPTEDIWYYQLDPGRSLGKTNPAMMTIWLSLSPFRPGVKKVRKADHPP